MGNTLATVNDFRICDACGASVQKRDVHKNRYAQYICRECRSSGVKAVGHKSFRYFGSKIPKLALGAIGVLVSLVLLVVLALLASSLHSYSNGGMVEDLKDTIRSINRIAR